MSVTGHPKFFKKSKCLEIDGGTVVSATSGLPSGNYMLDLNPDTVWRSSGSTDATTEEVTVEFDSAVIDRLLIVGHNLKGFNIQYDNAGTWTHFASVVGIDGAQANITETTFADDTAYYEFTPVTTTAIRIQATTTQTVNAEKYISMLILTEELGTLKGFPKVKSVDFERNNRVKKTVSGFYSVQKSLEVPSFDMEFKDYPATSTYNADMDLMLALHDSEEPFHAWLCGGKRGSPYFRYTLRGWRLKDVFTVKLVKALKLGYSDNVYTNQLNAKAEFESVIV